MGESTDQRPSTVPSAVNPPSEWAEDIMEKSLLAEECIPPAVPEHEGEDDDEDDEEGIREAEPGRSLTCSSLASNQFQFSRRSSVLFGRKDGWCKRCVIVSPKVCRKLYPNSQKLRSA